MSLVAGNVTGGGGKATTTKTKRHRKTARKCEICENESSADRNGADRQPIIRYINRQQLACTCVVAKNCPPESLRWFFGIKRLRRFQLVGSGAIFLSGFN